MVQERLQRLILLFLVGIFVAVAVTTWLIAVFTPLDFVVTTDYIVVDTGRELYIAVKPGKCVKLGQIYLPLDTAKHIAVTLRLNETPTLTSVLDIVDLLGNVTLDVISGTYNSTAMEICSGYVIIRYAK